MTPIAERLTTERLVLRATRQGDGAIIAPAASDSFDALTVYMPWAKTRQTIAELEAFARESAARFRAREELHYLIFDQAAADTVAGFIGAISLHHIDWAVPCFELGYWLSTARSGYGYMTEAVSALRDYAITDLGAARLEIRCDARNAGSVAVAVRTGFTLEARMIHKARANDGTLTDMLLFAHVR